MKIEAIYSFLVHPDKGAAAASTIGGTEVIGGSRLVDMLSKIFFGAPTECKHDICFTHNADGDQKNECRDLLLAHLNEPTKANGFKVAERLQSVTTNRSKLGLLFMMVGSKGARRRLVVSRFPADHGILASENGADLNVDFVERVFMQSATAYKSAVYECESDAGFWKGKAVDKQVNGDLSVANYWIRDFLMSEFAVTGAAGTRRFAIGLRSAIGNTDSINIKRELSALAQLLPNGDGKVKSAEQILADYNLSPEAVACVRGRFPHDKLFVEQFRFDVSEFAQHVAFRSVELDNGAVLTAEVSRFDAVFTQKQTSERVQFSTEGEVVDDKLRKTKA